MGIIVGLYLELSIDPSSLEEEVRLHQREYPGAVPGGSTVQGYSRREPRILYRWRLGVVFFAF